MVSNRPGPFGLWCHQGQLSVVEPPFASWPWTSAPRPKRSDVV